MWTFGAVIILAGALWTISRANPVTAVVSLVGVFFALGLMYASLDAHFLAVIQVMVYAGAIMVLFIFVVMVVGRDEASPFVMGMGLISRVLGMLGGVYLLVTTVMLSGAGLPAMTHELPAGFGTVGAVGDVLFREFLFPFEAVSLLLLVAVVGAVVVSRSRREEELGVAPGDPSDVRSEHS